MYSIICHLQSVTVLLSNLDSFYFSCVIAMAMARISNTMLNKGGENGHPCIVPNVRGNAFNFSLLSMMLAVGLSYMVFIMLRYILYAHFLESGFFVLFF